MKQMKLDGIDSPSGTLIKHTGLRSNWCVPHELGRVMKTIHDSAIGAWQDWIGTDTKYTEITIRTDMRTGHFILKDAYGCRIDGDDAVLTKLGLKEQRSGDLDSKPTEKTKYMIYEDLGRNRILSVFKERHKHLDLEAGYDTGELKLMGFADSLMHAQPHLNRAVIQMETTA